MNRRSFIAASSSLLAAPYVKGQASDRVYRAALIGSGWWGMNLLREGLESKRLKCVALAAGSQNARESSADEIDGLTGSKPKDYADFREMLEKEKPEIVIIATPDHWHALTTIAAVKAGAHVLVEKPTGHCVAESRAMLDAARQTGKVVQVGLHRRVGPHHIEAHEFLKSGKVGDIGMVRCFATGGGGKKEVPSPNSAPPPGLDWVMWCGPAPLRPFTSKLHPGAWRNWLDFGNGQLGDWGVHWLDQMLWWSEEKYPRRVFSTGGRPIAGPPVLTEKEQTSDAPDSQVAVFEFEGFTATWEHRRFADNNAEKHKIGAYFYGSKGTFHIGWRDGWTFYPANAKEQIVHGNSQLQEPDGHNLKLLWNDFLNAIDKGTKPACDIEIGHRSSVLPLLGMLSLKTGRSLQWDGAKEQIIGDEDASKLLSRPGRGPWQLPG
ncbi:MAG: gfo/Idh/MocA family oxidoreductase [Verrucomicrobiaceae bacterium]|nr:gfo/Idh/MocA family oxidoreductase [Verrucomicrobiaceae bacterium]